MLSDQLALLSAGVFAGVAIYVSAVEQPARLGLADRALLAGRENVAPDERNWTRLRDRWEYSHIARAAFVMAGFVALVTAATI